MSGVWIRIPAKGPLAQLVEQWTLNPLVVGSNPTRPTNKNKGLGESLTVGPRVIIYRRWAILILQAREVLRLLAEEGIEGSGKEAEPRGDGV